jgi:hypothetical protein
MDIKDYFIGRAKKYNQYSQGQQCKGHNCNTCIRRHFSFPYSCTDIVTNKNKNEDCINWSDDKNCPVD